MSVTHDENSTRRRALACVIGGVAGAAYVVVNATPLGEPAATILRVLAMLTLAWILLRAWPSRMSSPGDWTGHGFGAGYWGIVAVEVVLIFGGRAVIVGWLDEPRYFLPWLSLVVGVHFFAFVRVFHLWSYFWLGLLVAGSAVFAMFLVRIDAGPAVVSVFDAIVPGAVLLACGAFRVPSPRRRAAGAPAQGSLQTDGRVHLPPGRHM